ncbi:MAG TPA: AAA family ATPase [Solirubrobacterales bacterium]|nr:AAA family ATPase [Solirubrobacterales bacterium]
MQCPACRNDNRPEARFCDFCGARLQPGAPPGAGPESAAAPPPPAPEARADAPLPPGTPDLVGGRYRPLSPLGRSGGKTVFVARDERDEREVALALFDIEGVGEAALARSRREMRAMERLGEHPHVVPVRETGESADSPYIVSPLMPGGDVRRLLATSADGRLEIEQALRIAIDVCRALEHAHGCGIVHRDLKPANVWLAGDGAARLGDFSLAATGPAREGTLVGTVAYLPPEQALGRPPGPRSDLYSLGAMLYEMVAGQPPFAGDDAVSIIGQHLNAAPVAASRHNPRVPPALDDLLDDLLAKRPEERPASAAEARERLEAIRDAPPEEAATEEQAENPLEGLAGGAFVGREAELARLREGVNGALAGAGGLVLLAGEPGIGKTRTAEEAATYARLHGAKVHWGRCHEDEGAPPYWPWVQVIRSYCREADPVALGWELGGAAPEIARVVPEVAERAGIEAPAPLGEDEQARFRLFDSITGFLRNAASSRPLVIVIDDLHWADEPSLLLLRFLAREIEDSALLVIGTYRDVELGRHHPLSRTLGELGGGERGGRVVLRGLREEDVARYVEITAGADPSPELAAAVHAQTEGNPFFVSEVVRLLASEGNLGPSGAPAIAIPEGVRDVVGRRLDRLSEEANEALRVGAAVGRDFEGEVLERVLAGQGENGSRPDAVRVEEALAEGVAAQLLEQRSPGRFRFAHALVRETLYGEVPPARRPALHAAIASTLEGVYSADPGRLERRLAELAHHYNEAGAAGDPAKAVDYATRAGERALAQLGYEEAAELFRRALDALELAGVDAERRARLLVSLGEAEATGGHFEDARETIERAAEAARSIGSAQLLARAALALAYVTEVGYFDERVAAVLEAALDAIGPGDSVTRAMLLSWLAQENYWRDPEGLSARLHRESIEMARRLGDERTLAAVISRANFIDIGPESARQGVESNSEVLELARRVGDRELEMRSHVLRLRDHLQLGDIASVDRDLEAYAKLAEELRQPQHLWHVPLLRAMRALVDGRFDEAERLAEEARRGGERAGEPLAQQFYAIQASVLYRLQGRLNEIFQQVSALGARYPAIPAWRAARAAIAIQLGRDADARTELDRLAGNDFEDIPRDAQWPILHALLCEVVWSLGDGERARILHDKLAPFAGQVVVAGRAAASWGPYTRYLGLASAASGELDRAVGELDDSIELSRRMGERPFHAIAQLNLAETLAERDARGDAERAVKLVDACLATSQELGIRDLTERALAFKLAARGLAGVDVTSSIDEVIDAVESERPDIRGLAAPDGTVTILFSDIEDSTTMTERLGDQRWLDLLRAHNTVFRERLRIHGGYEVKNQGDGFMLVFPDPVEALHCAIEVQRAFGREADDGQEETIRVRMGLHTGEAIAEEGDFFGRNVILAARIAARARGGEILVSEDLRRQADGEDGLRFDEGREVELKGMAGTHTVYRAAWEPREAAV